MSSLQRGATGASKPKPVNVNSLYSGRNLAAGVKPLGKHGLQSVGKTVGVVRRMPPPATLPSLKAENNGQDPTINIVPQSGTGWNKSETAPEPAKSAAAAPANGPDLRPTWAKPQNQEGTSNGGTSAAPSNREFPTLAVSAQGKDAKPQNAWSSGALTGQSARTNSTSSTTNEDDRKLPARYYDVPSKSGSASYRSRFQGSNDARATQSNYYGQRVSESRDVERERLDSYTDSVVSNRSDDRVVCDERRISENFYEVESREEPIAQVAAPPAEERVFSHNVEREAAIERSRQKRMNARSGAQPEYRLLKRPERTEPIQLEDISDDEEEVQMTKLNKPAVRVMKRGNADSEDGECLPEKVESLPVEPAPKVLQPKHSEHKKKMESQPRAPRVSSDSQVQKNAEMTRHSFPIEKLKEKQDDSLVSTSPPAPAPTENIWAKRIEERESQEREKRNSSKTLPQAIIEQHFPAVNESMTMKVDKELARRPTDAEFARATLRVRRNAGSNDVRKTMNSRDEDRRSYQRERHMDQSRGGHKEVQERDDDEVNRYNSREDARFYNENEFTDNRGNYRDLSHSSRGRRGVVTRGRAIRGAATRPGRGRVGYTQYQIQKRPTSARKEEDEESQVCITDSDPNIEKVESKLEEVTFADKEELSQPRHKAEKSPSTRGGRFTRGTRGRGRHARGGHNHEMISRPHKEHDQEDHETQYPPVARRGRGAQHRNKRLHHKDDIKMRGGAQRRGSDLSYTIPEGKADRLKSPVASSEGHDEWETASESSGRVHREHREGTPSKRAPPPRRSQQNVDQNDVKSKIPAERIRSKNGQPARRTCHSPSDANNRKQSKEKRQQKHQNEEKAGVSDGLAGLDINNIAGVVVIDGHLQETVSAEAMDEFQEVLNKKAKKQKALQMQLKLEAEERRKQREKERQLRIQAQKANRAAKREKKKQEMEAANKENKGDENGDSPKNESEKSSDKKIPVTTVWNSAHVPSAFDKDLKDYEATKSAVIPSPIARPTPRSKSSASDTPPANRDEPQKMVEITGTLSSSQPLQGDDKYDFTFDPNIHEQTLAKETQDKQAAAISTGANSENGSVADDFRLKEKLNKVKDLWPGETEKQTSPSLPSNVAKVKPQPQVGEPPSNDIVKPDNNCAPNCQTTSQRSPGIGLGGLNFGYPMMLPDMGAGYSQPLHVGSLLPPPNAISPPSTLPTPAPFAQNQRPPQNRQSLGENQMYLNQRQPGMNQNIQTWAAPSSPFESVMAFGGNQQQPQQGSQFGFTNGGRMNHQHPSQMQQQRPAYPNVSHPPPQSKMNGAPPLMPFNPHPMDMMSMNIPPPPHNGHNMNGPQLGNHRNDRNQFNSMMANTFQAPPPHPQHPPPPVHQTPLQFTQPPPNMNPNIRFTQPPPALGPDLSWKQGNQPPPQSGQMYGQPNAFRGQPPMGINRVMPMPNSENWSSLHNPPQHFNSMNHNQHIHRQRMGMVGKSRGHDGSGVKRSVMGGHHHQQNHATPS